MDNFLHDMDDEMLVKFLLDEVNAEERISVQNWISSTDQNKKYFRDFELIWQKSKLLAASSTVDENAAWLRFQQRIGREAAPAPAIPIKKSFNWMKLAAMLIVAVGILGLFYLWNTNHSLPVTLATNEIISKDTLPDNSVVTLNKYSSLTYKEQHGSTPERRAKLKGEGFFNISPDKQKPFVVEVDGMEVRVVGTSFNIKSLADRTEIIVESGIVTVVKNDQLVTLTKGEKITVLKSGSLPGKEQNADKLYNYYRSREFVCDNTPLWKLVEVLNEAYETKIVIDNKQARDLRLNTTFSNEPIDRILAVIAETFDLTVTKTGDRIILK